MNTIARLACLILITLSLGACSGFQHRPLDPTDRQDIRTIGLLTPAVPSDVEVKMNVHPGRSLGVVGTFFANEDMRGKSKDFCDVVRGQGFDSSQRFTPQLIAGLEEAGYKVKLIPLSRDLDGSSFLKRYPENSGSVDAYLDIYSDMIGFAAAGGTTPYRPSLLLHVRLVRADDRSVIYQDAIAYNAFGDGDGAVTLPPAPQYAFDGFKSLMDNPGKAIEGLQVAMRETGRALARLLN